VSVPSSELAPPRPLSRKRVLPLPLEPKVWGQHSLRGAGEANSDDRTESLTLCILCDLTINKEQILKQWRYLTASYLKNVGVYDMIKI
jgi:hypothetical protein